MVKRGRCEDDDEVYHEVEEPHKPEGEKKDNEEKRIVLFPATKLSVKHPDYTGECKVEGIRYTVAVWQATSKAGRVYLRGNISRG